MMMMTMVMMMMMLMISSARMIATLEVLHRAKLSHPIVGNVATALFQSRQLHAIACCLLGRLQLGEIEPLALTQALVAALAGVSGASVPSPLAQGPSGVDLSSDAAQSASPCKGAVLNSHSDRAVLQSTMMMMMMMMMSHLMRTWI